MRPTIGLAFGLGSLLLVAACGGKTDGSSANDDDGGVDGGADTGGPAPGPTPDGGGILPAWTACADPSQCHLAPRTCCGVCGTPTVADVFSTTEPVAYHAWACASESGGGPTACPGCASRQSADLQPTCTAGQCAVLDVDADPISACDVDADCVLRLGTCCGHCGPANPWEVVAIHKDLEAAYRALVCAPGEGCPKCVGGMPPGVSAKCDAATRHCVALGAGG